MFFMCRLLLSVIVLSCTFAGYSQDIEFTTACVDDHWIYKHAREEIEIDFNPDFDTLKINYNTWKKEEGGIKFSFLRDTGCDYKFNGYWYRKGDAAHLTYDDVTHNNMSDSIIEVMDCSCLRLFVWSTDLTDAKEMTIFVNNQKVEFVLYDSLVKQIEEKLADH